MAEVAALGLRVDGVGDIKKAEESLKGLAGAAKGAQTAVHGSGAASAKAALDHKKLEASAAKAGMSVKQMQAALRGVPAQFTDIAVSLQGGMNPLTVFLQQGGQLKDMFGGAGGAARALGGYIVGLVNPFTVLAATVGAVAFAYYKGSQEADAFRLSIVKTGNASGVTTQQLMAYAAQIGEIAGTQGQAAEALNAFVAAGVRGDESLKQYAQTAMAWSKATGEGVAEVAEKFKALQKDPLDAALKLNEGMNFLTESTYKHIKALEEQGDKAGAAKVAMDALAASMDDGSKKIADNLGYIEQGWDLVAKSAKKAWNAMLDVGRKESPIKKAQEDLDRLQRAKSRGYYVSDVDLSDAKKKVAQLNAEAKAEERVAKAKADTKVQVDALAAFDKKYADGLAVKLTLEQTLAKVRSEALAVGKSEVEIQRLLASETEKYNRANRQPKGRSDSSGVSELAAIQARVKATYAYIEALKAQGREADKITEGERLAWKIQQEIDSGRLSSKQKLQKQAELAAAKELQAAQETQRAAENALDLADKAKERSIEAAIDRADMEFALRERLISQQGGYANELSAGSVGDAKIAAERIAIQGQQNAEIRRMQHEHEQSMREAQTEADRAHLESMYSTRLEMLQEFNGKELELFDDQQQKKKMKEQEDMVKDYAKSAAQSMQGMFQDFLFDPFSQGLGGMLQGFGQMIQKMIAQAVAADLMKRMFGNMGATGDIGGWAGQAMSWAGGLMGMAHDGIDNVPSTGTWLLQKGERVQTAETSARLDSVLSRVDAQTRSGGAGGGGGNYNVNVTVPAGSPVETRRAAAAGAREALSMINMAGRYA